MIDSDFKIYQMCGGTASQWEKADIVLLKNESGYDSTNHILKIGDGIHKWSELQSISAALSLAGTHGVIALPDGTIKLTDDVYNLVGTIPAISSKLNGIDDGAEVNVQSDWNSEDGDALILNKPTSMRNPYNLIIGSKLYDGSSEIIITKSDISLGNVDDTADIDKPISTLVLNALNLKADASVLSAHISNALNPHEVTAAQIGLGNVDNTSDVNKPISIAQQAALDLKANNTTVNAHISNTSNPHTVTKTQVGLGNVDNTSDVNKPISIAQQAALDLKFNKTGGAISGDITVSGNIYQNGETYIVDAQRVESEDDYILLRKGNNSALTAGSYSGIEANKYDGVNNGRLAFDCDGVARVGDVGNEQPLATRDESASMSDGKLVYWDSATLKFKTSTESVASIASNLLSHTSNTSNPHSVTAAQVGLGNASNTSDADKPVSTAQQSALNLKFDKAGGTITGDTTFQAYMKILGTAADRHLITRGIGGCSTDGAKADDLYINLGQSYGLKWGTKGNGHLLADGGANFAVRPTVGSNNIVVASDLSSYVKLTGYQSITNKTYNGYTLGDACEKAIGSIASGNTGLITGGDIYTELHNSWVPSARTVNGHPLNTDVTVTTDDLSLATVASSGSYSDLSDKPTNISSFTNDSGYISSISDSNLPRRLHSMLTTDEGSPNNAYTQGFHRCNGTDSTNPFYSLYSHNDFMVITTAYNDQWGAQLALDYRSNGLFVRNHASGVWSAWNGVAQLDSAQTFTGVNTFNAPADVSATEVVTTKFMTSNGGSLSIGKEGPNSGVMLRFDQVDGTNRLKFRGSATAGAMVWSQPESGSALYMDLVESGGTSRRISFTGASIHHPVKMEAPLVQTGNVYIINTPTDSHHAATKKYVDDNSSNPFNRSWSSGTSGSLTLTSTGTYEFKFDKQTSATVTTVNSVLSLSSLIEIPVGFQTISSTGWVEEYLVIYNGTVSIKTHKIMFNGTDSWSTRTGITINYRKLS